MADIKELEKKLYKLCVESEIVEECGWISTNQFCVWINYLFLKDFMDQMKEMFGTYMFDDGGFDANMQEDGVCIELESMTLSDIDLEKVFPKKDFPH